MLTVNELQKTYPTGDEALKGISLSIEDDHIVAIIGPSGAGKSTFVRCINRLTEPTDGEVWLDGTELTSLEGEDLRRSRRDIAMIFQEYNLVERLTVMENVLSGRLGYVSNWAALRRKFPGEDIARAYEILETVGMENMENNRADALSGGQRQRVGIARAIIQNPKILLADEPTSSLDPETSNAVMSLLEEISKIEEIPVLINIHEVPLAEKHADRIIGLHDGELVFDGSPEDLTEEQKDRIYKGTSPDSARTAASTPTGDKEDEGPRDEMYSEAWE